MHRFIIFILALFLSIMAATDKNQKLKNGTQNPQNNWICQGFSSKRIAARWRIRQINISQREKIGRTCSQHEKTERLRNELAQIKEDVTQSNTIETEQKKLSERRSSGIPDLFMNDVLKSLIRS